MVSESMVQSGFNAGFAVIAMAIIAGCTPSGQTTRDGEEIEFDQNRKRPLSYYEATLRPSDLDEEIEVVQKAHAETKTIPLPDFPEDSVGVEEEIGQGFRIQIFASASIDEANASRAVAMRRTREDSVYVVYDPPVYKVRVGDYTSRLEASRKLSTFIDKGYPDAWIVADRVVQRKLVRFSPTQTQK